MMAKRLLGLLAMALVVSTSHASVCAISGHQHVLMSDGVAKYTFQDSGIYRLFAITDPAGKTIEVQSESERDNSSRQTEYSTIKAFRLRVSIDARNCSESSTLDLRYTSEDKLFVRGVETKVAPGSTLLQGVVMRNTSDGVGVTIEIALAAPSKFMSVTFMPNAATIVAPNVLRSEGLCGSGNSTQQAPTDAAIASFVAAFLIAPTAAIQSCSNANAYPVVQSTIVNVSNTILDPVFASPSLRDAAQTVCSDGDIARISTDKLFGSFAQGCIYDMSVGSKKAAYSNMHAYVHIIEDVRRAEAVIQATIADDKQPMPCAACIPIVWEKLVKTDAIRNAMVADKQPEQYSASDRSFFSMGNSQNQLPRADFLQEIRIQKPSTLYTPGAAAHMYPSVLGNSLYEGTVKPYGRQYMPASSIPAPTSGSSGLQTLTPTNTSGSGALPSTNTPAPTNQTTAPYSGTVALPAGATGTPVPTTGAPGSGAAPTGISTPVPTTGAPGTSALPQSNSPAPIPTTGAPGSSTLPASATPTPIPTTGAPGSSALPASNTPTPVPTTGAPGTSALPQSNASTPVPTTIAPGSSALPQTNTPTPVPSTAAPGTSALPQSGTLSPQLTTETNGTSTPRPTNGAPGASALPTNGSSPAPSTNGSSPAPNAPGSSPVPTGASVLPATPAPTKTGEQAAPATPSPTNGTSGTQAAPSTPTPTGASAAPVNGSRPTKAAPSDPVTPMPANLINANRTTSADPTVEDGAKLPAPTTNNTYGCSCKNLDASNLRNARDIVTYAMESKSLPALKTAVLNGRAMELTNIMACGYDPNLAIVVGITKPSEIMMACTGTPAPKFNEVEPECTEEVQQRDAQRVNNVGFGKKVFSNTGNGRVGQTYLANMKK